MNILCKVTLLLLIVTVSSVCSGYAIEMVYPEDGTYILRSNYLIIKGGESPTLDGLTIEINELKSELIDISGSEYKAVFSDFIILEPEFSVGVNKIKLDGYAGGKVVRSTEAEVYYQKDPYAIPPSSYRPFVMHTLQKEALCAPCHNMQPTKEQLQQSAAKKNPCGSCHGRMLGKKNVHGPAGVFQCVYCHSPESKPNKYRNQSGDASLCNECHLDKVAAFKVNKYIHGPVAVGMCSVCHDSHASDHPAQLHGPINDVCMGCHEGLNVPYHFTQGVGSGHPVSGVTDPLSSSERELSCASCHDPHGGAVANFFDAGVTSSMMLCQKCHKK